MCFAYLLDGILLLKNDSAILEMQSKCVSEKWRDK